MIPWRTILAQVAIAGAASGGGSNGSCAGCAPPPPAAPASVATTEDPDALCGAAIRVFTRHGWHPSSTCETEARTVETGNIGFQQLHWNDGGDGSMSVGALRVIVSRGQFEIAASCHRVDEGKVVEDATCPGESEQTKQEVTQEILSEAQSVAGARRVRDQAPPPAAAAASGCTKDTDCKGDRVCNNGACVDPAPKMQ